MLNLCKSTLSCAVAACSLAAAVSSFAQEKASPAPDEQAILNGIKFPHGFEVNLFAAPPDVAYPTCVAAAPTGELFVGVDENGSLDAKGNRGRVVRCIDTNGDGRADKFNVFAEMDSPRGLWFDQDTLYVVHPPFVTAYHDDNGDGVSDRWEDLVKGLGFDLKFRGADHTVNGMRMGIDGWLYIAVGDYGALKAEGKDGSTFQLQGGGVARVRPDGSGLEVVSRGQRNIYDVAVSPELDLFTRDNTNDGGGWDIRLSHIIFSGHYGYPSLFKNFPDEIIQPLAEYGGGSPCGSLFLDEPGFPVGFGTALYTCEWGRNAVYRHPLERVGATFRAQQIPFLELPRPTDMDVDGQGRLFISSWAGGSFTYSGPNVGYVIRVTVPGERPAPFPDLKRTSNQRLLDILKSASAVRRLYAQREILRRGTNSAVSRELSSLARDNPSTAVQVAAIFTLSQLGDERSREALVRLSENAQVREFALRALADNKRSAARVPVQIFIAATTNPNPRVRLQAAIGLGRLGKAAGVPALLPLTMDPQPVVAHAAINSLVSLHAPEFCLRALDSASSSRFVPGAARVLQSWHEMEVADGLIARLGKGNGSSTRQAILKALCRLYQGEADWDGKWWGTRPDTSGPYFKAVKWDASDKIGEALRTELLQTSGEPQQWLVLEMLRNKVDLPEVTAIAVKLASISLAFRNTAIEAVTSRPSPPTDVTEFLESVARSEDEEPALRAKALRALQRASNRAKTSEVVLKVLLDIAATENPVKDLESVWEEFVRDGRNGRRVEQFVKMAQGDAPAERLLGFSVLINLAGQKQGPREARTTAARFVDQAWAKPDSTVSLLQAIARTRRDQYSHQVRVHLNDSRDDVRLAANAAANKLGLDKRDNEPSGVLIESLPYEEALAKATKGKADAKLGAELFVKQGCTACHTVSSEETLKGPFLGGIATRYSRAELCESILKPSTKIAQGFETQFFSTEAGDDFEGFVVREAGDEVEIRNAQGITTTLPKKEIKSRGKRETSMMPEGLVDKITPQELAALLSYLESIKSK